MTENEQAQLLVEVQCGIIPGTVDYSKRWGYTREEVESAESWLMLLAPAYDEFNLRMNPNQHNWVTMTWMWL
jgi:hypothetical protein